MSPETEKIKQEIIALISSVATFQLKPGVTDEEWQEVIKQVEAKTTKMFAIESQAAIRNALESQ